MSYKTLCIVFDPSYISRVPTTQGKQGILFNQVADFLILDIQDFKVFAAVLYMKLTHIFEIGTGKFPFRQGECGEFESTELPHVREKSGKSCFFQGQGNGREF